MKLNEFIDVYYYSSFLQLPAEYTSINTYKLIAGRRFKSQQENNAFIELMVLLIEFILGMCNSVISMRPVPAKLVTTYSMKL